MCCWCGFLSMSQLALCVLSCGIKDVVIEVMEELEVYPQPLARGIRIDTTYFGCRQDFSHLILLRVSLTCDKKIFGKITAYPSSWNLGGIYNGASNTNDVQFFDMCPCSLAFLIIEL